MKIIVVRKPSLFKMRTLTHLRTQEKMWLTCAPWSSLIHVPMGWGNNVHVPMHTQAQQPHHLSCCPADTGTALSWSVTGGVGRGGVEQYGTITFMFLCTHRQAQRPHHLSCCPADTTTALSWSVTGGVGWGGTITHVPVHAQAQPCDRRGHGGAAGWKLVTQTVPYFKIGRCLGQSIANGSRG